MCCGKRLYSLAAGGPARCPACLLVYTLSAWQLDTLTGELRPHHEPTAVEVGLSAFTVAVRLRP